MSRIRRTIEAATLTWRDGKRYIWPLGLLVPTLPLIALGLGLAEATGSGAFWFVGPVLLFAMFPLVDLWIGTNARNPPDDVIAGMIVLAAIPPLWRRVMDPLLVAHYGGDVTRANIAPRKRAQILARHAAL